MFKFKFKQRLAEPTNPITPLLHGLMTTIYGIWVMIPSWNAYGKSHVYRLVTQVAPEVFWGALATTVGLVMIYGVLKFSPRWLKISAGVGVWFWSMFFTLSVFGDYQSTICVFAGYFVIFNIFQSVSSPKFHAKTLG